MGPFQRGDRPSNLWRLIAYIKPYWLHFLAATICGVIKMLTPTAIAFLVGESIDIFVKAGQGVISADAAWEKIQWNVLIGIGLAIAGSVPTYLRSTFGSRAVQEVLRNLRCDLYAHIQKLSQSFFDANRSGYLTSRIIGDVDAIQPFVGRAFVQVWMSIATIAVILGYFFYTNIYLGLLSIALIPPMILVQRFVSWKVRDNARAIREQLAWLSGNTQEKLAASTIVKTFTREDDEVQRFSDDSSALVDLGVRNSRLDGISQAANTSIRMLGQLFVILIGGYIAIHHHGIFTIGLLVKFVLMQGQLYLPFDWLNEMQLIIANALGATDRIFTIFDTEPEIADKPHAVKAPHFVGDIRFEHVTFTYPTSVTPVFTDLTLHAPARTTLALVGPSGGGKTTVTNLINRFYEWGDGSITIDGQDIRNFTIYSLRHQIALVPQEAMLFSGTIEDNILYGRPDATPEEVRAAAKQAYADEFIEGLDDGYQTMLGERGVRLSGGQKQRISIARAFLKNPAILVLDEATSALDSESERIVQQALEDLMRGRTTIVIAHRLSTIRHADQIAVIAEGGVVENGTHVELLQRDGIYAMLCRQQYGLEGIELLENA